ncbi:S1 RNA-binding domain-containing protein [Candidatus Mycoplasma mahonii]|uniref:S1 RNA-binding domain-containing protein n=1 Tax=Candidatus Mycoplasma mahonii TaxID=3004105 RepID=UPI0026F0A1E8|nr:S1 RNA-binding domain-containing protein [Candidatus Mycoplasma mahonii]WKX02419.1 S1 RNA-binding domain-containing protein [Candidatus Mycoplasma mahonii]
MSIGDVVNGEIVKIDKTHLIVKFNNNESAILHISEISDYFVKSMESMFEVGETYNFLVINTKHGNKLSWKQLVARYIKNPFKFEIKEVGSGFKKLLANTLKEMEND